MNDLVISLHRFRDGRDVVFSEWDPSEVLFSDWRLAQYAEIEDEWQSSLEFDDGGWAWLIGYPASGPQTYFGLEINPLSPQLAEVIWHEATAGGFTIARWSNHDKLRKYYYDAAVGAERLRLEPPPAAAAVPHADLTAHLPPGWPRPIVLASALELSDFLSRS